jgi:mono/diheme cytochrome c family protein
MKQMKFRKAFLPLMKGEMEEGVGMFSNHSNLPLPPFFIRRGNSTSITFLILICVLAIMGCRQDMHDQPKYEPLERSTFFGDERSARPMVEGTVARGHLRDNPEYFTGKTGEAFVTTFPLEVTEELVQRGQQRYEIFCTPCHGVVGDGTGMVVRRGFKKPPSFHIDRLRQSPPGYFYDVMTNGFGVMSSYAEQIPVKDRWAIAAYVRALQLSQNATIDDVPADKRQELEAEKPQ